MNRKLMPLLLVVVGLAGCTPDFATQNSHTLFMEIASITGSAFEGEDDSAFLLSDVSNVANDNAVVTVVLFRKDPTIDLTSPLESVFLDSYEVRYFRTDGRNTEGVDVPYRTTGPLSGRMPTPDGAGVVEQEFPIIVVRHQAKLEPPLRNLGGTQNPGPPTTPNLPPQFQGAVILTTIAEITVYGHSLDGDALTAKGRLQVTFADFADE